MIGPHGELESITLGELKDFWYQTWYAPNNATLVIMQGDVRPEAALNQG